MAVRKSKLIGKTVGDFEVLDSLHIGTQTRFKVACVKCGKEQEKSWHSVVGKKSECDFCGEGRKKRNAGGYYGTPLYRKYMMLLRRTEYEGCDSYENYGGRGIRVCDEWQKDFTAFREWALENGYKEGLTIDRIDVDGDYSPDNCRWVDWKEQANNRRSNKFATLEGRTQTLAQWADEYGVSRSLVYQRMARGWSIDKALTEPPRKGVRRKNE